MICRLPCLFGLHNYGPECPGFVKVPEIADFSQDQVLYAFHYSARLVCHCGKVSDLSTNSMTEYLVKLTPEEIQGVDDAMKSAKLVPVNG